MQGRIPGLLLRTKEPFQRMKGLLGDNLLEDDRTGRDVAATSLVDPTFRRLAMNASELHYLTASHCFARLLYG